jgi:hypothetical protein
LKKGQILNYLDFANWKNINVKETTGKRKDRMDRPNTPRLGVRRGVTAEPVRV